MVLPAALYNIVLMTIDRFLTASLWYRTEPLSYDYIVDQSFVRSLLWQIISLCSGLGHIEGSIK